MRHHCRQIILRNFYIHDNQCLSMHNILKEIEAKKGEIIKLLSELIKENTVNPPGNEYLAGQIVEREFKKAGIFYRKFERENGRTNIIGYIGKGKPSLLFAAHLDTVPASGGWKTDPFNMAEKDGKLYGLGVSDDKGPLACLIVLAKIIKEYENRLNGQLIIGAVADEETGSKNGMKYLIDKCGVNADYAIIPDVGHNMKKIDVAEKGILRLYITSIGKQAHGSSPRLGINAVYNMVEFLNLLKDYRLKHKKHELLGAPTINLGMINGGNAANSVPAKCDVVLDIRYLPTQKVENIVKQINNLISDVKKKNKTAKFIVNVERHSVPTEVPADNILVKLIQKHSIGILKEKPVAYGLSGATVIKQLIKKKILSVGFGPGGECHCANEKINLNEMVDFMKISALVVFDLIG